VHLKIDEQTRGLVRAIEGKLFVDNVTELNNRLGPRSYFDILC